MVAQLSGRSIVGTNDELTKTVTTPIDGVKIDFVEEEGWALIRRSNTSPVIILRMEVRTKEGLREIEEPVIQKFKKFKTVDLTVDEYVRGIMRWVKWR